MGTTTRGFSNYITNVSELSSYKEDLYVFVGNAHDYPNESTAPVPNTNNYDDMALSPQQNMLYGIKVGPSNITAVIDRYNWATGQVYEAYHNDSNSLFTTTNADTVKPFHIYASGNVYKCINNNNGTTSTVEPSHTDSTPREESDGYVWKYMFSVDPLSTFLTDEYIPVVANTVVQSNAVESIERIVVENAGNTFIETASGTVASVTNTTVFSIESPTLSYANGLTVTPTDDFFNGTSILLYDSGLKSSGSLFTIQDYVASSQQITLDSAIGLTGLSTSKKYEISPRVVVQGDGEGATAIATVNQTTKGITGIEMKNVGSGYSVANVYIDANTGIGAVTTAVLSPPGGHGKRPYEELNADKLSFTASFVGNEAGDVFGDIANGLRNVGLIANPSPANTSFVGTVDTTVGSAIISGTQTKFDEALANTSLGSIAGASVAAVALTDQLTNTAVANTAKADILNDLMEEYIRRINTTTDLEKIVIEGPNYRRTHSVLSVDANTSIQTLESALSTETGMTYRKLFSGDVFDQTRVLVMDPAASFTPGESVSTANNAQFGTVVQVTANNLYVVGTDFTPGATVTGADSTESSVIVSSTPNANSIDPATGNILYINNVVAVSKSASSNVDINITVKV